MSISNRELSELIMLIHEGDSSAFVRLIRLTSAEIKKFSSAFNVDEQTAAEVYQDTLISIWKHAGTFDPKKQRALPWLITVMRSRALDRRRINERNLFRSGLQDHLLPVDAQDDYLEQLATKEKSEFLWNSVELVSSRKRDSLLLHFKHGLTSFEIANRQGVPQSTIKSHIKRGLNELRGILREHEFF